MYILNSPCQPHGCEETCNKQTHSKVCLMQPLALITSFYYVCILSKHVSNASAAVVNVYHSQREMCNYENL